MAISIQTFDPSASEQFTNIINAIRDLLRDTGFYESVEIVDGENDAKSVKAFIGEDEYYSITLVSGSKNIVYKMRQGSTVTTTADAIHVVKCGNTAVLSFKKGIVEILSNIFCVSNQGTIMQIWSTPDQMRVATGPDQTEMIDVLRMEMREYGDTDTNGDSSILRTEEKEWMTLSNICGKRDSNVYFAKNVTRMVYRQSNIPDAISEDATITKFSMEGEPYVTDGHFVIYDDVGEINSGGNQNG